ncbi:hypothetical protein PVAP13_1NG136919 [Panicum virgatum]|uniref:Uncharacterized protein n=1 Tax=Panicum virgatum TaxID=38727 RepID=A0A8T0WKK4_PANVG|nr:hypothetical protein PVAP13_1NG136919 [Panicum virgatum]
MQQGLRHAPNPHPHPPPPPPPTRAPRTSTSVLRRRGVDAAVDHVATYYEHKARSSTPSLQGFQGLHVLMYPSDCRCEFKPLQHTFLWTCGGGGGVDRGVAAVLAALWSWDGGEADDALELATAGEVL